VTADPTQLITPKQTAALRALWSQLAAVLTAAFADLSRELARVRPWVDQAYAAHRVEVRRVHTAYRRRRGGRW
jgi:hypothetical protein